MTVFSNTYCIFGFLKSGSMSLLPCLSCFLHSKPLGTYSHKVELGRILGKSDIVIGMVT